MTLSRNRDEELDYAYLRDIEVGTNRSTFIRLVRATDADGGVTTVYGAEAHVDVDGDGEVIAVSVLWGPN